MWVPFSRQNAENRADRSALSQIPYVFGDWKPVSWPKKKVGAPLVGALPPLWAPFVGYFGVRIKMRLPCAAGQGRIWDDDGRSRCARRLISRKRKKRVACLLLLGSVAGINERNACAAPAMRRRQPRGAPLRRPALAPARPGPRHPGGCCRFRAGGGKESPRESYPGS